MKEKYWSKVILFGEYSMIFDSNALLVPLKRFSAKWTREEDAPEESICFSRHELSSFCEFLRTDDRLSTDIDSIALEKDLKDGWWLASDVPVGYGLGSSGTVVAAVYDRYALKRIEDAMCLKELFSRMESYFHGSSSGIDPLQCYLSKPFRITSEGVDLLDEIVFKNGIDICLIDTKVKSSTKPLVEYFKRQRENEAYLTGFRRDYLPDVGACIDAMIQGNKDTFFMSLQRLMTAQLSYLGPMIPEHATALFESAYDFHFGVKINGAGGGGYMLGFTDDRDKASSLLGNYDVLWLDQKSVKD